MGEKGLLIPPRARNETATTTRRLNTANAERFLAILLRKVPAVSLRESATIVSSIPVRHKIMDLLLVVVRGRLTCIHTGIHLVPVFFRIVSNYSTTATQYGTVSCFLFF